MGGDTQDAASIESGIPATAAPGINTIPATEVTRPQAKSFDEAIAEIEKQKEQPKREAGETRADWDARIRESEEKAAKLQKDFETAEKRRRDTQDAFRSMSEELKETKRKLEEIESTRKQVDEVVDGQKNSRSNEGSSNAGPSDSDLDDMSDEEIQEYLEVNPELGKVIERKLKSVGDKLVDDGITRKEAQRQAEFQRQEQTRIEMDIKQEEEARWFSEAEKVHANLRLTIDSPQFKDWASMNKHTVDSFRENRATYDPAILIDVVGEFKAQRGMQSQRQAASSRARDAMRSSTSHITDRASSGKKSEETWNQRCERIEREREKSRL